ncbi:hypothetical protein [Leifsonia sp. NPDC077715]|uniref:hypothetical protein n=1 Tax=Leifsonia sp. NPDC077715 TaxID=3155539 RepID=UPI00341E04A5
MTSYWWVVQGANYRDERDRGILWAPYLNKNGHRKSHWSSMGRVSVGDIVVHYADLHVRAVSRVTQAAEPSPRPFASDDWDDEGQLILTSYEELPAPLHRDEIPLEIRTSQTQANGPFFLKGGRVGHVNLGYLFDLTERAGGAILDLIEGVVPVAEVSPGAAEESTPSEATGSHRLVVNTAPVRRAWIAPRHDSRVFHPRPTADDLTADTGRIVTYEEFELQSRFGRWLESQNTPAEVLLLTVGSSVIQPDFHVPARSWIVEAKKSEARPYVRLAIGQVLDYVAAAERHNIVARPVILLPRVPADDLVDLVGRHGIWLAVPAANADDFTLIAPWIRATHQSPS